MTDLLAIKCMQGICILSCKNDVGTTREIVYYITSYAIYNISATTKPLCSTLGNTTWCILVHGIIVLLLEPWLPLC